MCPGLVKARRGYQIQVELQMVVGSDVEYWGLNQVLQKINMS